MNKKVINQLNPKSLWTHFSQFCLIPRPSKHEEAIVAYIRQQGEKYKATVEQDKVGNILLQVPASQGLENAPITALQSHVDMVAQANNNNHHDFMRDPLQLQVIDGWVKATGTTLGADNGIGCAAMLALMTDDSVIHGPLELLFTVDEEAGMGGAFGLQSGWLKAKQLLNLDTEEEGEIYIGCAGGVDINSTMEVQWQAINSDENKEQVKISLTGLLGGHSGVDIHLNRANANILLSQELLSISQLMDIQIHSFNGGTLRNAIPREAFAVIYTSQSDDLLALVSNRNDQLKKLYGTSEFDLCLCAERMNSGKSSVVSIEQSVALFSLFASHPNGVIKMSDALPGVVESSNNLGVISLEPEQPLTLLNLCRSASDVERDAHAARISQYQQFFNLTVDISGAYPGWQPDNESPLLKQALDLYQNLFEKKATIQVIHAGLECGLLSAKYPNCDMISFGPTITGAHSPREQVNINSVEIFWNYLVTFIAQLAEQ